MVDPIIHPDSQRFFKRKQQPGDAKRYASELQRLVDKYSALIDNAETDAFKDELQLERKKKIAELKAKFGKDDSNPYCLH